jgi:hypothetical protein
LPYPPFKLRDDPKKPNPHTLVDGKFLAMSVILSAAFIACGREMQADDIAALDDYVHRCKLGPCRPGRAARLRKEAEDAETQEQRKKITKDLNQFLALTKSEMSKLRRIQENRLTHMSKSKQSVDKPKKTMIPKDCTP